MPDIADVAKRLLIGRPVRSDNLGHTLLPKRLALPIFASDALSSVAYAPDEIILTLSIAGLAASTVSLWAGIGVCFVMLLVVLSYRQNVHEYPDGGGNYEVATVNLGSSAGLTVASALLVDYTLTVAVSISSAAQYAAAAIPALAGQERNVAVAAVVFIAMMNLRGVRESGRVFAIPVYMFMAFMGLTAIVGGIRYFAGALPMADSSQFTVVAQAGYEHGLMGFAGALLFARAFASGCAALTGVEAISNGVPVFRKPKIRNAQKTLAMLGGLSAIMVISILLLAQAIGVRYVADPASQLIASDGGPIPASYVQNPTISQLASSVFQGFPIAFYAISVVTGLILMLAANTAFNGFPMLGSILGRDGFLPKQLHSRGDRLAFSNGIIALAIAAVILIVAFNAEVTRLIQLYIVGVFVSFTMSQFGMLKHWSNALKRETNARTRGRIKRNRLVNGIGFVATGFVLIIVLITKFTHGAWIAILAMAVVFLTMKAIHRHYTRVAKELAIDDPSAERALPSRVHAIVLVSSVHKATMRAIAYARASRPNTLEALTVAVDPDDTAAFEREWEKLDLPISLRVLDSPYREITRPVVNYVRSLHRDSPRDLVVVYIPEYVVGHWWETLLHNQSALRLKTRLHFTPGVIVASVPWQLASSEGRTGLDDPIYVNGQITRV